MTRPFDISSQVTATARQFWWLLLVRGIFAVIFGIMAVAWPGITALALAFVFGIYAIMDGVASIVLGFQERKAGEKWGATIVLGVLSIVAGIIALVWPVITALALLYVVAFWAIIAGVMSIAGAFGLRKAGIGHWGWTLVFGILSVVFGLVLLIGNPVSGILGLIWAIGIFVIVEGIALIAGSFAVRSLGKSGSGAAADTRTTPAAS
ncbi:HdeD family acid-resistance protein [Nakamurella leprariae]|uniref:HdeD family acid-resistance protein n=1 Tax=Nakamurella leprariae TaxID=2803911 RepID=A0A938YBD3_9ACTN|nr:HdeD family acid-resistance protein [Nakamurella leprariae]MBM9466513.1 HdeD family acid-resistance protein [Nakamurella leprariae]